MPRTVPAMSLASGPIVSSRFGAIGYTPSIGTKPKVVFKPTTPQQAAGTRIEPAVSVPNETSASSFATATADPLDEPPGRSEERRVGKEGRSRWWQYA